MLPTLNFSSICSQLWSSCPNLSTILDIHNWLNLYAGVGLNTQTVPITTLFLIIAEGGMPRIARLVDTFSASKMKYAVLDHVILGNHS